MKKLTILICSLFSYLILVAANIQPLELKILYVGIDPLLGIPKYDLISSGNLDKKHYEADISMRMNDFKTMLQTYFSTVECIDARKYQPSMSDLYDVTIFDSKVSLPYDFSQPALLIAQNAPLIGEPIGLKTDWYCLCLRDYAFNLQKDHPIFKEPFATSITMNKTPNSGTIYNYINGNQIPLEIPMWRVEQNKYEGYRIGMISHGNGFEDSPDTEAIAGGKSLKSIDAVAIGRHGNYLMWGFAASPQYMTDEAKNVFANAICYISRYAGQKPIARKFKKGITGKQQIKENIYILSPKAYKEYISRQKATGREPLSRDSFIKNFLHKDLYNQFKGNLKECEYFLKQNMKYFYGQNYSFVVDNDAKTLDKDNESIDLISHCITLWKQNSNVELAQRILQRYTLENFKTVEEWEAWFIQHKDKLFFSESCGYKFIINDRNIVQNFKAPKENDSSSSEKLSSSNPIIFRVATNKFADKGEIQIIGNIIEGFHIYASGPSDCPYVMTKIEFVLPTNFQLKGNLKTPSSHPMKGDESISVYEGKIVFKQKYEGHSFDMENTGKCLITYQCCDNNICMPPITEELDFSL